MDKTLYVVSGFMRTGTSMMMRALEAGGMDACYKQSREEMRQRFADEFYDPNVGGLYELERGDYRARLFPRGYEGKLIKGLNFCVPRMAVMRHGIRVVFMRRNSEEIRQSYAAFFGKQLMGMDRLDDNMDDIVERIGNRKDVLSVNAIQYRRIVDDPLPHFLYLQKIGWPISAKRAAAMVDPQYYRFKLEELAIGVI